MGTVCPHEIRLKESSHSQLLFKVGTALSADWMRPFARAESQRNSESRVKSI
jgi:hypothetical protein